MGDNGPLVCGEILKSEEKIEDYEKAIDTYTSTIDKTANADISSEQSLFQNTGSSDVTTATLENDNGEMLPEGESVADAQEQAKEGGAAAPAVETEEGSVAEVSAPPPNKRQRLLNPQRRGWGAHMNNPMNLVQELLMAPALVDVGQMQELAAFMTERLRRMDARKRKRVEHRLLQVLLQEDPA